MRRVTPFLTQLKKASLNSEYRILPPNFKNFDFSSSSKQGRALSLMKICFKKLIIFLFYTFQFISYYFSPLLSSIQDFPHKYQSNSKRTMVLEPQKCSIFAILNAYFFTWKKYSRNQQNHFRPVCHSVHWVYG